MIQNKNKEIAIKKSIAENKNKEIAIKKSIAKVKTKKILESAKAREKEINDEAELKKNQINQAALKKEAGIKAAQQKELAIVAKNAAAEKESMTKKAQLAKVKANAQKIAKIKTARNAAEKQRIVNEEKEKAQQIESAIKNASLTAEKETIKIKMEIAQKTAVRLAAIEAKKLHEVAKVREKEIKEKAIAKANEIKEKAELERIQIKQAALKKEADIKAAQQKALLIVAEKAAAKKKKIAEEARIAKVKANEERIAQIKAAKNAAEKQRIVNEEKEKALQIEIARKNASLKAEKETLRIKIEIARKTEMRLAAIEYEKKNAAAKAREKEMKEKAIAEAEELKEKATLKRIQIEQNAIIKEAEIKEAKIKALLIVAKNAAAKKKRVAEESRIAQVKAETERIAKIKAAKNAAEKQRIQNEEREKVIQIEIERKKAIADAIEKEEQEKAAVEALAKKNKTEADAKLAIQKSHLLKVEKEAAALSIKKAADIAKNKSDAIALAIAEEKNRKIKAEQDAKIAKAQLVESVAEKQRLEKLAKKEAFEKRNKMESEKRKQINDAKIIADKLKKEADKQRLNAIAQEIKEKAAIKQRKEEEDANIKKEEGLKRIKAEENMKKQKAMISNNKTEQLRLTQKAENDAKIKATQIDAINKIVVEKTKTKQRATTVYAEKNAGLQETAIAFKKQVHHIPAEKWMIVDMILMNYVRKLPQIRSEINKLISTVSKNDADLQLNMGLHPPYKHAIGCLARGGHAQKISDRLGDIIKTATYKDIVKRLNDVSFGTAKMDVQRIYILNKLLKKTDIIENIQYLAKDISELDQTHFECIANINCKQMKTSQFVGLFELYKIINIYGSSINIILNWVLKISSQQSKSCGAYIDANDVHNAITTAIKKPLSGTLTIYILAYNGRLPWKNRAFRDIVRFNSNGERQDVFNGAQKVNAKSKTITHETLQNTHDSHIIRIHNVNEGDTISMAYRAAQPLFAASIEINNHIKSLMKNDWTLTGDISFTNPKFDASKASIIKSEKIPNKDINELMIAGAPPLGDGLSIIPTCKDMGSKKYCQYRLNFKVSGLVQQPSNTKLSTNRSYISKHII
jgi:hypothetical protein